MIKIYDLVNYIIAGVWLINGMICKILNLVPRHEEIVSRILSEDHSRIFTILIGCSEVLMAVWIVSGITTKLNAITQIIVVATMNIIEFVFAPDLLLWGHYNSLFAFLFILLIYFNEFQLKPKTVKI